MHLGLHGPRPIFGQHLAPCPIQQDDQDKKGEQSTDTGVGGGNKTVWELPTRCIHPQMECRCIDPPTRCMMRPSSYPVLAVTRTANKVKPPRILYTFDVKTQLEHNVLADWVLPVRGEENS